MPEWRGAGGGVLGVALIGADVFVSVFGIAGGGAGVRRGMRSSSLTTSLTSLTSLTGALADFTARSCEDEAAVPFVLAFVAAGFALTTVEGRACVA